VWLVSVAVLCSKPQQLVLWLEDGPEGAGQAQPGVAWQGAPGKSRLLSSIMCAKPVGRENVCKECLRKCSHRKQPGSQKYKCTVFADTAKYRGRQRMKDKRDFLVQSFSGNREDRFLLHLFFICFKGLKLQAGWAITNYKC